ncbi:MAG: GNAT family N-acetyltransferase [Candidatus Shapirobacteria bacterium]
MKVRLATIADKQQVLSLFDEFSVLFKAKDIPSQIGGEIFDEIIVGDDTKIFVAEDGGKLVGLATFYLLPNIRHGWHRGHIEDFFTTKSYRGKGVGTKIFEAIKEYCQNRNIKVIKLDSDKNLHQSHKFYEKNGGRYTENMFRFDL